MAFLARQYSHSRWRGGRLHRCRAVGIADRYQDLATVELPPGEFDPSLQDRLLTQYGVTDLDQRKLQFHLMLDELF
jgi:aminoglycoside phosphotransferase